MKHMIAGIVALGIFPTMLVGQGSTVWDESLNGPLSNDPGAATFIGNIQVGTNRMAGAATFVPIGGGPGGAQFSDFVTFDVGSGFYLAALTLEADAPVAVWIGNGTFGTEIGSVVQPKNGDLLAQMALAFLPGGTYSLYVSDEEFSSNSSIANYSLSFVVVSEPSTFCLWTGGMTVSASLFALRKQSSLRQP